MKPKAWYPKTFVLPEEKPELLQQLGAQRFSMVFNDVHVKQLRKRLRARPRSLWIGKPRNDYGGQGICVYRATDTLLRRSVRKVKGRSILQQLRGVDPEPPRAVAEVPCRSLADRRLQVPFAHPFGDHQPITIGGV